MVRGPKRHGCRSLQIGDADLFRGRALTDMMLSIPFAGPIIMPTDRDQPDRKTHRLSTAVYAATDYEFHFTVCARHQGAPFTHRLLADKVIESLLWTKAKYEWLLFCYCLMPDHLHFVCRLPERDVKMMNAGARGMVAEGVLDHLGRFKSFTTNASWKLGYHG